MRRAANVRNLKPDDWLTVYHGTRLAEVFPLINGFDAAKVRSRSYGGPRHRGLFITPNFKTARGFASYGPTVLELVVRAKNLHGTDYSGVTGRDDPHREEIWRDTFPNSFRPYLSQTLSQGHEPQALLQGLVSPRQIKRVWYAPQNNAPGQWYTRKEFLELGLEATPASKQPYGKKEQLRDLGIDLSYPNYSHEKFIEALSVLYGSPGNPMSKDRIRTTLGRYLKVSLMPGVGDKLAEVIERSGFEPRAAQRYADRLRERIQTNRIASKVRHRYRQKSAGERMFPWKTILKKARMFPQMEAQLDLWARASFLESWLQANHLLPSSLKGFSSRSPGQIAQGLTLIGQQFGGDTIAPQWTSLIGRRFYLASTYKARDYLRTFEGAFEAEEEIQDLFQEKALKGFKLAGSKLSNLNLSDAARSENTALAWMRTYFLREAQQFAIKFFRRKSLLKETTQGPLEMQPRRWTTDSLLKMLLTQMFNPVGRQPVGAARTIILKIWEAWETELSEVRFAILKRRRENLKTSDAEVAQQVSEELGETVTWTQVRRAKQEWETIAKQTLAQNPRLLGELEDAIQIHLQMSARTPRFASQNLLRGRVIRLAYQKTEIRALLLPLL